MTLIRYKNRTETNRIILHDSHTTPEIVKGDQVERWAGVAREGGLHMGLLGIGYHFIIERDGTKVIGREVNLIGTHTPTHNLDSIGICLVGGREDGAPNIGVDNFTGKQRLTLFKIIERLEETYGELQIVSHSEVQKYRNRQLPPCPPIDMELLRADYKIFKFDRSLLDV